MPLLAGIARHPKQEHCPEAGAFALSVPWLGGHGKDMFSTVQYVPYVFSCFCVPSQLLLFQNWRHRSLQLFRVLITPPSPQHGFLQSYHGASHRCCIKGSVGRAGVAGWCSRRCCGGRRRYLRPHGRGRLCERSVRGVILGASWKRGRTRGNPPSHSSWASGMADPNGRVSAGMAGGSFHFVSTGFSRDWEKGGRIMLPWLFSVAFVH
jgi:hypothetical protein